MKENEKEQKHFPWSQYGIYFLIVAALTLLVIAFRPTGAKPDSANEEIVLKDSERVYGEPAAGDGGTFKRNEDGSIYSLIDNYYDALLDNDDVRLMRYVDDVAGIPAAQRALYSIYAERVDSLDTYVISGLVSRSYVVAGISYLKIKDVETLVPIVEKFSVLTNESGNVYITMKELNENMVSYNELMYENGTMKKLLYQMALEYDQTLDKEPLLGDIFKNLSAGLETQPAAAGTEEAQPEEARP